ncbi:MAG: hypothetical protein WDN04_22520 [Rhodospirillales bacterium]
MPGAQRRTNKAGVQHGTSSLVGIDVSGKQLDAGTYPTQQTTRVAYTDDGIATLRPGLPSAMWQVSPWKPPAALSVGSPTL